MTHCNHSTTVVFSRTMVIDRCVPCGEYLVWCVNLGHEGADEKRQGGRHWHPATNSRDAIRMAGAVPDDSGRNRYGIIRPEPRAAVSGTMTTRNDDLNTEQANQ